MRLTSIALSLATLIPALTHAATPIALDNAGFESSWVTTVQDVSDGHVTFHYQPGATSDVAWSFGSGTGLAESYDAVTAYQGNRFAFLQFATGPLSQGFSLASDSALTVSFAVALRPGYSSGQVVGVLVDGTQVGTIAAVAGWQLATFNIGSVQAGGHTLGIVGLNGGGNDTTAFIDAVQLSAAPVPEPASVSLMLAGVGALALRRRAVRPADR